MNKKIIYLLFFIFNTSPFCSYDTEEVLFVSENNSSAFFDMENVTQPKYKRYYKHSRHGEKKAKAPDFLEIDFSKYSTETLNNIMQYDVWKYPKLKLSNLTYTKFACCCENFLQSYNKRDCAIQEIFYSYNHNRKFSIEKIDEFFTNLSIEARVKIEKLGKMEDEEFGEQGPFFFEFFNILVDINKKSFSQIKR